MLEILDQAIWKSSKQFLRLSQNKLKGRGKINIPRGTNLAQEWRRKSIPRH